MVRITRSTKATSRCGHGQTWLFIAKRETPDPGLNQVGETTTNSATHGMDIGSAASVTVGGIVVGAGVTAGWGAGYSLTLGETALFSGGIPPFVDDPTTDADEYVDNFYRVAPVVYRQSYTDDQGNETGFFVATYAIDM